MLCTMDVEFSDFYVWFHVEMLLIKYLSNVYWFNLDLSVISDIENYKKCYISKQVEFLYFSDNISGWNIGCIRVIEF